MTTVNNAVNNNFQAPLNMNSNNINNVTDPASAQDAATKNYTDTGLALKLALAGGTMSGAINMGSHQINAVTDPAVAQDAATKHYVDVQVAATNYQPNVIYSGNFDTNPWQAGVSFAAITNDSIIADGWKWFQTGTGVVTAARNANAPSFAQAGMYLTNSMGITVTTADTSITSTKLYHIQHVVEGIDWTQVYQQAMTLSFWVYATVTGIHCISISNAATTRCFIAEYTVAVTNTWQFVVVNVPADSTGTWLLTPGTQGAYINFANAIGSATQAAAGWGNTFGYSTSNQVNDMGTIGNKFLVDLVYLQAGTIISPIYPLESYQQVLAKSQRFYFKTYDQGIYPGSSSSNGTVSLIITATVATFGKDMQYKQSMAIVPTITVYDNVGTAGKWYIGSSGQSVIIDGIGMNGARIYGSAGTSGTMQGHFVANAYLY